MERHFQQLVLDQPPFFDERKYYNVRPMMTTDIGSIHLLGLGLCRAYVEIRKNCPFPFL